MPPQRNNIFSNRVVGTLKCLHALQVANATGRERTGVLLVVSGLTEVCIVEYIPRQDRHMVYVSVDEGVVKPTKDSFLNDKTSSLASQKLTR